MEKTFEHVTMSLGRYTTMQEEINDLTKELNEMSRRLAMKTAEFEAFKDTLVKLREGRNYKGEDRLFVTLNSEAICEVVEAKMTEEQHAEYVCESATFTAWCSDYKPKSVFDEESDET